MQSSSLLLLLLVVAAASTASAAQPNILFLLTDDQDVTAHSLDYMQELHHILREGGTEYLNYFVPTGLCCPSRSTLISGQFCHNTGIWDNGDLNNKTHLSGGLKKIIATGLENITVATQLKEAGYETYLVGKYMNGYEDGKADYIPPGWDHWYGMTDTAYYGPHFSVDGKLLKTSKETYQTDFISETVQKFIRDRKNEKPFFMYVSPFAPHGPSLPAKRHANLFSNLSAPRYDSYNPSHDIQSQKPSWIKNLPELDQSQLSSIDEFYRNRLRALQAVDEMLLNFTTLLDKQGELDNTYIFYMGDNGQHLGDFRLPAGKRQAYDTDVRVPFLVRGPGVPKGGRVTEIVMSVDLFPTWMELADGKIPEEHIVDGQSITSFLSGKADMQPAINTFRSVALTEMFGGSSNMGQRYKNMTGFERNRFWNNTYQSARIINGSDWAENANWMYAEWCTGEREFYNVTEDPHEVHNLIDTMDSVLLTNLSMLLASVANCTGSACWKIDYNLPVYSSQSSTNTEKLRCFNPKNLPGEKLAQKDDSEEETPQQTDHCSGLFAHGFPFADNDIVSDDILEKWNTCQR